MSVWFHGGYPGLRPWELVEPPDTTGTNHTLSRYVPPGAPHGTRTDVVYITSSKTVARVYAAWYPNGAVYVVEPYGDLEPDPDAPGLGAMCGCARVVAVLHPQVIYAHRTPQSWLQMLDGAR